MSDSPVIVTAFVKAKDHQIDRVAYILTSLIVPTRKEEGCISYDFHQSVNDKTLFISYEIWQSAEAFHKHLDTPYIKALGEVASDLLAVPLEITIIEKLG